MLNTSKSDGLKELTQIEFMFAYIDLTQNLMKKDKNIDECYNNKSVYPNLFYKPFSKLFDLNIININEISVV